MRSLVLVVLAVFIIAVGVMYYLPQRAYQRAHTIREYKRVIEKYPSSTAAIRARRRVEQLRFERAMEGATPKLFIEFERDYPESRYLSELPRTPLGYPWSASARYEIVRRSAGHHPVLRFDGADWLVPSGDKIEPPPEDIRRPRYPPLDHCYVVVSMEGTTERKIGTAPGDWHLLDEAGREYPLRGLLTKNILVRTDNIELPDFGSPAVPLAFLVPVTAKQLRLKPRGEKPVPLSAPFVEKHQQMLDAGRHLHKARWLTKEELLAREFQEVNGRLVSLETLHLAGAEVLEGEIRTVPELLADGWIYRHGRWLASAAARKRFPARYMDRWCTADFARMAAGEVPVEDTWYALAELVVPPEQEDHPRLVTVQSWRHRHDRAEALALGREGIHEVFAFLRPGGVLKRWKVTQSRVGDLKPAGQQYLERYQRLRESQQPETLMELSRWWITEGRRWVCWTVYERMGRLRAGALLRQSSGWQEPSFNKAAVDYTQLAQRIGADTAVFLSNPFTVSVSGGEVRRDQIDGLRFLPGTGPGRLNPSANLDYVISRYGLPQAYRKRPDDLRGMLDYYRYDRLWLAVNEWNDIVFADLASIPWTIAYETRGREALRVEEATSLARYAKGQQGQPTCLAFSADGEAVAWGWQERGINVIRLAGSGLVPHSREGTVRALALSRGGTHLLRLDGQPRLVWPTGVHQARHATITNVREVNLAIPEGQTATAGTVRRDRSRAAVGTDDGTVCIYHPLHSLKPVVLIPPRQKAPVQLMTCSPDGHYVAWLAGDIIGVGEFIFPYGRFFFRGTGLDVQSLRFAPDSRRLLITGQRGAGALDVETRRMIIGPSLPTGRGTLLAATVLPDLNYVAAYQSDRQVRVLSSQPGLLLHADPPITQPAAIPLWRMGPNGLSVAAAGGNHVCQVHKLQPRFKLHTPREQP